MNRILQYRPWLAALAAATVSFLAWGATPPTITSPAAANPAKPAVLAATTFTVGVSGGNPPLSYSWDFGDGSTASTALSPVHAYAVAGTYKVVFTVTDFVSATATSSLNLVVTDAVKSPKLLIQLNFKKPGKDTILLQGTLRLDNTPVAGQALNLNIAGVSANFTLNKLGAARLPGAAFKLFIKSRPASDPGVNGQFIANLTGSFQSALASSNYTNRNADQEPVQAKVTVTFQNKTFTATINQSYTARQGGRGIGR